MKKKLVRLKWMTINFATPQRHVNVQIQDKLQEKGYLVNRNQLIEFSVHTTQTFRWKDLLNIWCVKLAARWIAANLQKDLVVFNVTSCFQWQWDDSMRLRLPAWAILRCTSVRQKPNPRAISWKGSCSSDEQFVLKWSVKDDRSTALDSSHCPCSIEVNLSAIEDANSYTFGAQVSHR